MEEIKLAKTAGFCFGVGRAIKIVNDLLEKGKNVCTLGPIIHNTQMVDELSKRGVRTVDSPKDANDGETLVIRAHGVPIDIMDQIKSLKIDYNDATCPFVLKIHKIVKENSKRGKLVLIAGDKNHPEVKGIYGNCLSKAYIFGSAEELIQITNNNKNLVNSDIIVVSQTTFSIDEWKKCLQILKKDYTNATIFDTICNATFDRQSEAQKLAKQSDLMIVVGGRHSSNTVKLKNICSKYTKTYLIEHQNELDLQEIKNAKKIGVTAGASTPASIIKEVIKTMNEVLNDKQSNNEENLNFEQMLEESLKSLNTDDRVKGVVVSVAPNEVCVDVGRKQAGFIPASELSYDPDVKPSDVVKVGDELELLIMKTNDQEGTIMLSKKRLDAYKVWDDFEKGMENGTIFKGKVKKVINGGVIATSNGARVFIPASLTGQNRNETLNDLLDKEISFKIIEVNKSRRRAVGSVKAVQREEREKLVEKFWENAEVGKKYKGKVRSITNYGVFVDLGGIDGMIHISELSWKKIKHPSEIVKVGDELEVYIKNMDRENGKVALGYKKDEDNPWEIFKKNYKVNDIIDVKIVNIKEFGAFANIIDGLDGLIHVSQISNKRGVKPANVLKVGQTVKAKIISINDEQKHVSLSMKAVIADEDKQPADNNQQHSDNSNEVIENNNAPSEE